MSWLAGFTKGFASGFEMMDQAYARKALNDLRDQQTRGVKEQNDANDAKIKGYNALADGKAGNAPVSPSTPYDDSNSDTTGRPATPKASKVAAGDSNPLGPTGAADARPRTAIADPAQEGDYLGSGATRSAGATPASPASGVSSGASPSADMPSGAAAPSGGTFQPGPSGFAIPGKYGDVINRTAGPLRARESGGNNQARPIDRETGRARSSAYGPDQFIDSTWLATVRKHAPEAVRGKSTAEILAMRSDPQFSGAMKRAHLSDIAARYDQLGIPVTARNLYAGYFSGPDTAAKLIRADPNTPLSQIYDTAAQRANPELFARTGTAGALLANFDRTFSGKGAPTGQGGVAITPGSGTGSTPTESKPQSRDALIDSLLTESLLSGGRRSAIPDEEEPRPQLEPLPMVQQGQTDVTALAPRFDYLQGFAEGGAVPDQFDDMTGNADNPAREIDNSGGFDMALAEGVQGGIKAIMSQFGFDQRTGVPAQDPTAKDRYMRMTRGEGAVDSKTLEDTYRRVDPEGKMTPDARNENAVVAILAATRKAGRADVGFKMIGELLQTQRTMMAHYGGYAAAAASSGDWQKAAEYLTQGYDFVPDGHRVVAQPLKSGQGLAVRRFNRKGEEVGSPMMIKDQQALTNLVGYSMDFYKWATHVRSNLEKDRDHEYKQAQLKSLDDNRRATIGLREEQEKGRLSRARERLDFQFQKMEADYGINLGRLAVAERQATTGERGVAIKEGAAAAATERDAKVQGIAQEILQLRQQARELAGSDDPNADQKITEATGRARDLMEQLSLLVPSSRGRGGGRTGGISTPGSQGSGGGQPMAPRDVEDARTAFMETLPKEGSGALDAASREIAGDLYATILAKSKDTVGARQAATRIIKAYAADDVDTLQALVRRNENGDLVAKGTLVGDVVLPPGVRDMLETALARRTEKTKKVEVEKRRAAAQAEADAKRYRERDEKIAAGWDGFSPVTSPIDRLSPEEEKAAAEERRATAERRYRQGRELMTDAERQAGPAYALPPPDADQRRTATNSALEELSRYAEKYAL